MSGVSDVLGRLFGKKRTLDDVTLDELRYEKIRLEQEEAKLARKVEELENQKQQLFLKGKDEPSERKRRIIATQIKEQDVQARNLDRQLQFCSRQLRIINGLIQVKENQALLSKAGLSRIIGTMDIGELRKYVERASVEGAFQLDRFQEILNTLEEPERVVGVLEEEKDVEAIMRAMAEAKALEMENPSAAAEEILGKLGEALSKTEEPEREP